MKFFDFILLFLMIKTYINIRVNVSFDYLNVIVLGDFGLPEDSLGIKMDVVKSIKKKHKKNPFNLGLMLGDNVYPHGVRTEDHNMLFQRFTHSFPSKAFKFRFLAVLGNHDYEGDPKSQIQYHFEVDQRFYMPYRYYFYGIVPN
ncbi:hypothetical protein RF11_09441 [Thelohanellus kitauei]|uniref:Calcineurin-like phosphoesterase domain-containing protein n=1 Tax=Thelohanellus kitauei TaxID=669202 RepID=A0A0C2ITP0_THEKT|nr:hypothetical protein RF11_09441 [Thelohanellus kitauei]